MGLGSAFVDKALTMSGLLVKKLLTTGSLLAFVGGTLIKEALGGTLVKKLLAMSRLLTFVGSMLIDKALAGCHLEAVGFVLLPQFVDCPLPILVNLFHVGTSPMKNRPPGWILWQQPSGLLVFVKALINPFLFANVLTNVGRGIVCTKIIKDLVGCARRGLNPFVLQPCRSIKRGIQGQEQMSWWGSITPHLGRIREGVSTHLY